MNKKGRLISIILIIIGMSLLIGSVSADKTYSIKCPSCSSDTAIVTEKDYTENLGNVKIKGAYYKEMKYETFKDAYCNSCSYKSSNYYYDYKNVKYGAKEVVSTSKSTKYWKTVKSKGNTYKYYKIMTTKLYGDTSKVTKQTGTEKYKLFSYNKKATVHEWELYSNSYNNGYIKISKTKKQYSNGKMGKVYDPRSKKWYYNQKASSPKFNFKSIDKNVKITKVATKSYHVHYSKSNKFNIINPKKSKWYMPKKLYYFWSFTVYYTYKTYRKV